MTWSAFLSHGLVDRCLLGVSFSEGKNNVSSNQIIGFLTPNTMFTHYHKASSVPCVYRHGQRNSQAISTTTASITLVEGGRVG